MLDLSSIEGVTGGKGADVILGDGRNNPLSGGDGNDYIYGDGGEDVIMGGNGDDVFLYGCTGNDKVSGNAGKDLVVGAAGADTLNGGEGNDTLVGDGATFGTDGVTAVDGTDKEGADVFVFGHGDTILDWDSKDKIDISMFEDVTEENFYSMVKVTAVNDAGRVAATGDHNHVKVEVNGRSMMLENTGVGDVSMGDFPPRCVKASEKPH